MTFSEWIDRANRIAWGPWMLILLVGTGIYFSIRLGFLQIRKFGYVMRHTVGKLLHRQTAGAGELTPMQAMSTALAATVGTGSIAGVVGAILVAGPGTVFWMWVSAFFGMLTKYAEVVLSVHYRQRNPAGEWVGGPMYYIQNGLGENWRWLALAFSSLACLSAFGIGNMTQTHTIAISLQAAVSAWGVAGDHRVLMFGKSVSLFPLLVGAAVASVVALVLFGGVKRIGTVTEKLVPFMAGVYILASLAVILANLDAVGPIFSDILRGALKPKAVMGGFAGAGMLQALQMGIGRGVFSNEAGLGSAPMAHAATSETDPVLQGFYGIFEVFVDTFLICTVTALVLLCGIYSGVKVQWGTSGGAELISASFATVFGDRLGAAILAVCIALFALSTLLSWSLYGARCAEYLLGPKAVPVFRVLFVLVCVVGACMELELVWNIADTLNGFMALPNLVAVLSLSGVVLRLTKTHFANRLR